MLSMHFELFSVFFSESPTIISYVVVLRGYRNILHIREGNFKKKSSEVKLLWDSNSVFLYYE